MYADRFRPLIHKYPREADAIERVAHFFEATEAEVGDRVASLKLDPERLFEISQAGTLERLGRVVQVLIREHLLKRSILVMSPSGSGIASFDNIGEIPSEIHDSTRDVYMEVKDDDLKVIYTPVKLG